MGHKSQSSIRFWRERLYRLSLLERQEQAELGICPVAGAPVGKLVGPVCPTMKMRCGRHRWTAGQKNLAYYRGNTQHIPLNRTRRVHNVSTFVDGTRLISPNPIGLRQATLPPIPYPRFDWQAE